MYKSALDNLKKKFPNNVVIEQYVSQEDLINLYYPNIDLFIIPRVNTKISNTITPLKPYDIMANRVPLLMSNLDCLTRISGNETNCLLFDIKNDPKKTNLYHKIISIKEKGYPKELIENGYNYAVENRWESIVSVLEDMNKTSHVFFADAHGPFGSHLHHVIVCDGWANFNVSLPAECLECC